VEEIVKIDWDETYRDRLKQIEIEIKREIRLKHWGLKKILDKEKVDINKCLSKSKPKGE